MAAEHVFNRVLARVRGIRRGASELADELQTESWSGRRIGTGGRYA
jgi:hypothetical protein